MSLKVAMLTTDGRECYAACDEPAPYFGTAPQALLEAVREFSDLEMHVISCWQKPRPASEKLAANIWFHGLVVPKIGWLRTGYQGCVRAVRRKLTQIRPDVVHGQGTERDCGVCAAWSGFPNVVTIHGNMKALKRIAKARIGSFLWCAAIMEDFTLKRTWGVLCNSTHTENLVRGRTRRTWQVPNALRNEFLSSPGNKSPVGRCMLLNVGTISELKQSLKLLELAEAWYRKGLQFELRFAGMADLASDYVKRFLKRVEAAEKAGYARYLGVKYGTELVELYDSSHAIIHVPQEESFGLAVAEGLARNLKLFAFKVGGIMDIATGVDGLELIASNDWVGLSNAVESWIQRGYPRVIDAGKIVRERYHPRVIAERHVAIYQELLGRSSVQI